MRVHILALNGVFDTGLAAVLDAFGTANALAEMTGISSLRFQIKVVGLRKSITTAARPEHAGDRGSARADTGRGGNACHPAYEAGAAGAGTGQQRGT